MKFQVDRALCDGNGLCAIEVPELLKLDEFDELVILRESFGDEYRARAERAVNACPKCALAIADG